MDRRPDTETTEGRELSVEERNMKDSVELRNHLKRERAYLPSDPHLAGPTSIYIVKPADQQDQTKNQHYQPDACAILNTHKLCSHTLS